MNKWYTITQGVLTIGLWLNIGAVILFGWFSFRASWITPVQVAMRYTELDRAQVINEEVLAEEFPDLAANARALVGPWLAEPALQAEQTNAWIAVGLAIVNLIGLGFLTYGFGRPSTVRAPQGASKTDKLADGVPDQAS